jgi:hypothetical protein
MGKFPVLVFPVVIKMCLQCQQKHFLIERTPSMESSMKRRTGLVHRRQKDLSRDLECLGGS